MNGQIGDAVDIICSVEQLLADRKFKESYSKQIIAAVCALLNSHGGKILLRFENKTALKNMSAIMSLRSSIIRMLEQRMVSIIGIHHTISYINVRTEEKNVEILVKKAYALITVNYNLYLPSETQILQLSGTEPLEVIKNDILKRRFVEQPVQLGSHHRIFVKDESCGFLESKVAQFRCLKDTSTKRTRLGDRITGRGNRLTCYVSAFGNHAGGHIYYGIRDDGIAEGESIPTQEDISNITMKVEKVINKMTWPDSQPQRGVHWEIVFEPVLDENSNSIPSIFVIVLYIAPCLGGVFTEPPECYEMVDGRIEQMSFLKWKKRMLPQEIPSIVQRITWGSTRIRNICSLADQLLTQLINNGRSISEVSDMLQNTYPKLVEVKLVVLSKNVMACYRKGSFKLAEELLEEYKLLLPQATDVKIFDAIRLYVETALHRAKGDLENLNKSLSELNQIGEEIAPSLITAALYLLSATVQSVLENLHKAGEVQPSSPDVSLSLHLAIDHLKFVKDSPIERADLEQKAHTMLALYCLGCTASGKLTIEKIDERNLREAEASLTAVRNSVFEGNIMNHYRELQFILVESMFYYRHAQLQSDKRAILLIQALQLSKKAQDLASNCHFEEMLNWARECVVLCTADLLRTRIRNITRPRSSTTEETRENSSQKTSLGSTDGKMATKEGKMAQPATTGQVSKTLKGCI